MTDQDAAARALVNALVFDDNPVLIARAGKCEQEMAVVIAALRAEREAGKEEILEGFKKHHDDCNDFRHCECASAFWYEFIGKPWMVDQQAQEEGQ